MTGTHWVSDWKRFNLAAGILLRQSYVLMVWKHDGVSSDTLWDSARKKHAMRFSVPMLELANWCDSTLAEQPQVAEISALQMRSTHINRP